MDQTQILSLLQQAPYAKSLIFDGDDRIEGFKNDIVYQGKPDAVLRASNDQEISEILNYAYRTQLPVTFCGNQTSLTGSSAADAGLLIATSKMNKLIDIDFKNNLATAQAGIILSDFQDQLAAAGYFYPPDPTSRWEACLGATVATNATGEDSLLYGSTRCHVAAIKVIHADGSLQQYQRGTFKPNQEKSRAGYFLDGETIDHFIGSEGTLGFISEITVKLIPHPADYFAAVAFFPNLNAALDAVGVIMQDPDVTPRCLELLDHAALNIIATHPEAFKIPSHANCALYFKQEFNTQLELEKYQDLWFKILDQLLINEIIIATNSTQKTLLRKLRHHIPSNINERAAKYHPAGGGKVTTDWWVPLKHLRTAVDHALNINKTLDAEFSIFGHIGNGHPHLEYLVKDAASKQQVERAVLAQYQLAAKLGGGVAAEHGIGKIKRHLLPVQCSPQQIKQMLQLKSHYDPHQILGQGNLF